MTTSSRREREREEMRNRIISAAAALMAQEGLQGLSIRRIAEKIDYSPAIIYHYFKDKDDILQMLMTRGHQSILSALSQGDALPEDPALRLTEMTKRYLQAALSMPEEYLQVQATGMPEVLHYTAMLFPGAADKKPALRLLRDCVLAMHAHCPIPPEEAELAAQLIASATLGLAIKLIVEKDIEESQRQRLIERFAQKAVIDFAKGANEP